MTSEFKLAICEIHNPHLHGFDQESDPNISGHFLVHSLFTTNEFYNGSFEETINLIKRAYNSNIMH